eukprot:10508647-Lingulodinium_polyedra.AAC.1
MPAQCSSQALAAADGSEAAGLSGWRGHPLLARPLPARRLRSIAWRGAESAASNARSAVSASSSQWAARSR